MPQFNPHCNQLYFYHKRQKARRKAVDTYGDFASYTGLMGQFFTGGRTRFPAASTAAIAAKRYTAHKVQFISDDDYTNNFYIYLWCGYTKTSGTPTETNNANSFDVVGASMHAFISGAWSIQTLISNAMANQVTVLPGGLLRIGPFRFPVWVPPETLMSVVLRVNLPSDTAFLVTNHVNRQGTNEGATQTIASSDFSLTVTGNLGGSDGRFAGEIFAPSFITCEHKDGLRTPVFWCDGDSIEWGKNTNENILISTTYGSMGALAMAMDSKTGKRRYPYMISAIPGISAGELKSRAAWAKRLDLIRMCPNRPYTHMITNQNNNVGGTYAQFKSDISTYAGVMKDESRYWGDREAPLYHLGILPKPGTTNWATDQAGQTGSGQIYPSSNRWLLEADLLAGLVPNIDSMFKLERVKFDLADERDKWKVLSFVSAIATGGYTSGAGSIVLNDNPGKGAMIVVDPGGANQAARHITATPTGTGPYTCQMEASIPNSFLAGVVVKTTLVGDTGTSGGTHPSTPGAELWSLDIIDELAARFG